MRYLKIRLVKNKKELEQVFRIRKIVFVKGQNVPIDREIDGLDNNAKHVIVFYKNKPVGCARIRFIGKKAKLERIALVKKYRGRGFGKSIMDYLVRYCKKKKVKEIYLHSQCYIRGFYESSGFKKRGKTFMDAGIKHVEMYLKTS